MRLCFHSIWTHRTLLLYVLLLIGMAGLYCGMALPAQKRARATIAEAHTLMQRDRIYTDSLALVRAIEAFDTPIGKVGAHNTLAKAYFYLGNYYWFCTPQYEQAALCYTQADYYLTDYPDLRSLVNLQMAGLCTQGGADSLAGVYTKRAAEFSDGRTIKPPFIPTFQASKVEMAMAVRTLEGYLSQGTVFIPWRFGVGLFATTIVLLSVFFLSFYRTSAVRLQTQAQQIQEIAHSVDTARETELRYNISELLARYPTPDKTWSDFDVLKRVCNKPLLFLIDRLEQLALSEKEITFCTLCLLYPDMPLPQIADCQETANLIRRII